MYTYMRIILRKPITSEMTTLQIKTNLFTPDGRQLRGRFNLDKSFFIGDEGLVYIINLRDVDFRSPYRNVMSFDMGMAIKNNPEFEISMYVG